MKKRKPNNRQNVVNSRKVIRKQKRRQKKVHRQEHYMKKRTESENTRELSKNTPGRFVRRPADATDTAIPVKKKKTVPISVHDALNKERKKEIDATERLKSQMEEQRRQIFLQANEDEDKIIKKLEKQLGLNKSKNKNNYFADDGLDYLLEICDRSTTEQIVAAEKHLAEVGGDSDFEDDLATVTGKKDVKSKIKDSSNDELGSEDDDMDAESDFDDEVDEDDEGDEISGDFDDEDDSGGDSDADTPEERPTKLQKLPDKKTSTKVPEKTPKTPTISPRVKNKEKTERIISADDLSKVFSDDEVSHLSGDEEDFDDFSGDELNADDSKEKTQEKPDVWEDIYGRKRDKEGNIIKEEKGIYIPPHLRDKDTTSDKQLEQLRRQIKSVLNKLSGTNLHWACTSVEKLYSTNSRHSVNSALSSLWTEAVVGRSPTPDRMVAEHAALVAVLHANVATEIGAHFLQELTKQLDERLLTAQPMDDKRLENLVSCLAHLYTFKIYQATLLYDILGRLVTEVSEKHIDCILVVLRAVGGVLRKEEPLALRDFIHSTQEKLASLTQEAATGSRIKFLLEVLMAVKNNNLTKIPNYDPSYTDQLKKAIKGVIRKGNYVTPLNIRLDDLLKADERGKWWIVGSAWEGARVAEERTVKHDGPSQDSKLLELARRQRMNTDVRRNIFCVIMAAQDYMDAFEKLQHLGLKGQQEREVVHVLVACCLQERTYNPFYAVLGQKLCDTDRKYQLSIQFSVWDKIKDIESLSKQAVTNLAQFLIHLIMEKGLALSVLKVIQFSELNKHTVKFMRQVLLSIIMNEDLQGSLQVFHRVSKPPKLHMFRESLRLFIQHFLIKNAGKKSAVLSDQDMATLKQRALEVDKILTMHESKLKF